MAIASSPDKEAELFLQKPRFEPSSRPSLCAPGEAHTPASCPDSGRLGLKEQIQNTQPSARDLLIVPHTFVSACHWVLSTGTLS